MWRVSVLQEHFLPAIAIEITQRERTTILNEIEANSPGDIAESAIAVVRKEDVSFIPAPSSIRAKQFVNCVPSLLVSGRRLCVQRGLRHYLPPEEAVKVVLETTRHHPIRRIEVGKAIMIEVPGVTRPRPSANADICQTLSGPRKIRSSGCGKANFPSHVFDTARAPGRANFWKAASGR